MKKIKLKTPAKINLTLDVVGINEEGYHDIISLVTSIDIYDYITIKKRKDFNIVLNCKGIDAGCSAVDNNAYKSAKKFAKKFKTHGATVTVDKRIPVGGGLGGSSANIAGVLGGMKTLYDIKESVVPIADSLGSDSSYMLKGGWAVLNGRGDKQEFLQLDFPFYLIVLTADKSVSSKKSYNRYDELNISYPPCTKQAIESLKKGDFNEFCRIAKNDLQPASASILPEILDNITALKSAGAPLAVMTGSGSAVVGVFNDKKQRDLAYKKLKGKYKNNIIKCNTI